MPKLKTTDNHLAISLSSDIVQICKPLFDATNVSFFNFVRIFDNGNRLSLGTKPDWLMYFFIEQFHEHAVFQNHPNCYKNKIILWDGVEENLVMQVAKEGFDLDHGMTLISKKANGYCDFFHFATSRKHHGIINMYINHLDYFERFKLYFMEASRDLIGKPKPYVPIAPIDPIINVEQQLEISATEKDQLIKSLELKRYHVGNTYLTHQEMQCLELYTQRFSAKEMGLRLNLSYRTVQNYIERIKHKLQFSTINEAIRLYNSIV